jgi:DNA-binding protein HU-beta
MNTIEIADQIAREQGLTKAAAKQTIETVVTAIVNAAAQGEEVSLSGFGKFKVTSRAERQGRNPATGATIKIAASKKLSFTPAKAVKDALNPVPRPASKKKTTAARAKKK